MPDPMKPEFTAQNPIVEAAERLRARRQIEGMLDASGEAHAAPPQDAEESMAALHQRLLEGANRLSAVLGVGAVKIVRLERPRRLRIRFADKRIALDLDPVQQLVRVSGCDIDGEYQFDLKSDVPALHDVSRVSTQANAPLTASSLLKLIAKDAELPRPAHLDNSGPLRL